MVVVEWLDFIRRIKLSAVLSSSKIPSERSVVNQISPFPTFDIRYTVSCRTEVEVNKLHLLLFNWWSFNYCFMIWIFCILRNASFSYGEQIAITFFTIIKNIALISEFTVYGNQVWILFTLKLFDNLSFNLRNFPCDGLVPDFFKITCISLILDGRIDITYSLI